MTNGSIGFSSPAAVDGAVLVVVSGGSHRQRSAAAHRIAAEVEDRSAPHGWCVTVSVSRDLIMVTTELVTGHRPEVVAAAVAAVRAHINATEEARRAL